MYLPWCFIVFTIIMHFQWTCSNCLNIWGLFSFLAIFPSCDLLIENSHVISGIYWLSVLFWACLLVFIILSPIPCYFPFPLIHKQKQTTPYSLTKQHSARFFVFFFYRTNSPHLVGWVFLDFQHQFAHQGTMKIQRYFLVGNFKSTLP